MDVGVVEQSAQSQASTFMSPSSIYKEIEIENNQNVSNSILMTEMIWIWAKMMATYSRG
jgi:hypothetical protein